MAVQAQYPSNVLLLGTRGEQERKEMDYPQAPPVLVDQSAVFFSDGVNGNPRKRGREIAAVPMAAPAQQHHPISLFSLQSQPCSTPLPPPTVVSLAQLQSQTPPLVSTGLRLAFEDQQQQHQDQNQNQNQYNLFLSSSSTSSPLSCFLSEELAAEINQQKDEIEQFLHAQGEHLRRALAERRQRHYRALLGAAEESAARRLREKEAEVERATRRRAELEDHLARLRTESMAWQAKAMAEQAKVASLHAQLHQATAVAPPQGKAEECGGELAAEDAESAHVDPDRVEPERACRACRYRPVSVVLLPCRHLCLCSACDAAASDACPVCRYPLTGSVQVFLS